MDFNHSPEQQIYLAFNKHELADLALPVPSAKEMRAAGRPCIIQIKAHRLSGHG
jgi:hypothetical protein